jgi:hypothetical protein
VRLRLLPVLALAASVALAGCEGGADPGAGPGSSPSPIEPPLPEGTDLLAPGVPEQAAELCGAFALLQEELVRSDELLSSDDEALLPAAFVDAFRRFGAQLVTIELPPGLTDDQADGVDVLGRLVPTLPDDATGGDLRALEEGLDSTEQRQVRAIDDFVSDTCAQS